MTIHLRSSRAVFRFSGPEALKLLFDVVTGRVVAEPGQPVWWALLSPQGKIQAEGLCIWAEGAFWLDVDAGVADEFYRRMRMYRLRAKVEIDDLRDTHVAGWTAGGPDGPIAHVDPRGRALGWHIIAPRTETSGWDNDEISWHWARISDGLTELGPDFAPDTAFPHDIGMDLRGGVDFKKGCYIGQEVVSRMEHRGTARRRPVIVEGANALPGSAVVVGGREAGAIGMTVNGEGVAILRLDRITDPDTATINGIPVRLAIPSWGTYRFGESAGAD